MGLLLDLTTKTIDELAAITDAAYEGDPGGTDAKDAYFLANVHNYLKDIGKALLKSRTYPVSPGFGDSPSHLGTPFFSRIYNATAANSCYTQIKNDGSGSSNKALMEIGAKADSYSDNLLLDHNGYVTLKGESRRTCVISGTTTISAGVHIFENLTFAADINISAGSAEFRNCNQTAGECNVTGGNVKLIITGADYWGTIEINSLLDGVQFWASHIKWITGLNGIIIPANLTNFIGEARDLRLEGAINDTGGLLPLVMVDQSTVEYPSI